MSNEAVCRTAPATPGLLIIYGGWKNKKKIKIRKSGYSPIVKLVLAVWFAAVSLLTFPRLSKGSLENTVWI